MNDEQRARRFLRDHVSDDLVKEVDLLLERLVLLETKVDFAVGYIHENTQSRLDRCREMLGKVESALDCLRVEPANLDHVKLLLIACAAEMQAEQHEIRGNLTGLLRSLRKEVGESESDD